MIRLFIILITLTTISACSQKMATTDDTPELQPPPEDFQMTFGISGLPAGRMQGYTVHADGKLIQWEGKYPGENVRQEGQLTPEQVHEIWADVESSSYFTQSDMGKGMANHFMNITANGEARRITWNQGPGQPLQEGPVQSLYNACSEVVKAALEK